MLTLNEGQAQAREEIHAARKAHEPMHLLTGYAGTGKTTLMQAVVRDLEEAGIPTVVSAPTHKATSVLRVKLQQAGLETPACTIHSLLGLRPAPDGEKDVLRRSGTSSADTYRVVVIDECSMISTELFKYIRSDLRKHFVLLLGDPAQIPPVGESESPTFEVKSRSNLPQIVRQAEGNPIIAASKVLRACQDAGRMSWEWTAPAEEPPFGIYPVPGHELDDWLREEFLSEEFEGNNDAVRVVCRTNRRVAELNAKIRSWKYGHTETPFVPGERVICRTPIQLDGALKFANNEEATVRAIEPGVEVFKFPSMVQSHTGAALRAWEYGLAVWRIRLGPEEVPCIVPQHQTQYDELMTLLANEGKENRARFFERFKVKEQVSRLQCVYAMTAHVSQGSTFGRVFVDVADIAAGGRFNPKETAQLFYVAVTRASQAVGIIGHPPRW